MESAVRSLPSRRRCAIMAYKLSRNNEMASLQSMKHASSAANVEGRSRAQTREQAGHPCALHGLLSADSFGVVREREVLPPDMLREICDRVAFGAVHRLQEVIREANAAEVGWLVKTSGSPWDPRERARFTKTIMKSVGETVHTLLALRQTSRFIAPIIHPTSAHWTALLDVFQQCSHLHARDEAPAVQHVREGRLSPMRACVLVTTTGCEACGAARIRKVQWPFGARFCYGCLKQLTTSDFRIWQRYRVSGDQLREHDLPCVSADLYAPRAGGYRYTLHFYLNAHVLRLLRHVHGVPFASLDEAYEYVNREGLAYSRTVEQRNADMFHAVAASLVSRSGVSDSPRDLRELREVSSTFDRACKRPPDYAPHIQRGRRFSDAVIHQWVQHLADKGRRQWRSEAWWFERDVARPFVRALLRDHAGQSSESIREGAVEWLFARLRAKVEVASRLFSGGTEAGPGTAPATTTVLVPAFDSEHALTALRHAADDEDVPVLCNQARKICLLMGQLQLSKPGKQLTARTKRLMPMRISDVPDYLYPSSPACEFAQVRIAESVLLAHGPCYEPPTSGGAETNAMVMAALPVVDPIFPQGVKFDMGTQTFTCPCGRTALRSLQCLETHLRGSPRHAAPRE